MHSINTHREGKGKFTLPTFYFRVRRHSHSSRSDSSRVLVASLDNNERTNEARTNEGSMINVEGTFLRSNSIVSRVHGRTCLYESSSSSSSRRRIVEAWRGPHQAASGRSASNVKRCIHLDSRLFRSRLDQELSSQTAPSANRSTSERTRTKEGTNGRLMAIAILRLCLLSS